MEKAIRELQKLNGKKVEVITMHKWFGKEKYNCQLSLITDNDKIGFKVQNSEVYILKSDLESIKEVNGTYYIKDALMEIEIAPI